MEARYTLKSRLLTKVLQLHRPKNDRHTWAWKQRDKLISAWLLCFQGGGETLSNEELSPTTAVNLCLPAPCVAVCVGEPIRGHRGRILVDEHRDSVQATNIRDDHGHGD